jgi:hypothetical protein
VKQTIEAPKSMLTVSFNLNSFAIVDLLPENESFTSAYFRVHILYPLVQLQLYASVGGDNSRRKLRLHFDNSACHTSHAVVDEMERLCCKRVPHSTYCPDLAIYDLFLFGRIKEPLAGVTVVDTNDLRNEVMSILVEVSEDEKSRAFEHSNIRTFKHWIERCEWVAEYVGDCYHTEKDLVDLISRYDV